jgi:flagellar hook-associated protein 2
MDIDSLVLKMTAASRQKVTKQEQSLQKLEWKQTAYRSVTAALTEFRDKYLNSLSTTNFKSGNLYNTVKATVGKDVTAFTATAQMGTGAGKAYVNSIKQLATSETITNQTSVTNPLTTKVEFTDLDNFTAKINDSAKDFMITLDGVSRTVVIDDAFVTDLKKIALKGYGNLDPSDDQIKNFNLANVTSRDKQAQFLEEALQNRINALFDNPGAATQTITVAATGTGNTSSGSIDLSFSVRADSGFTKLTLGYATEPATVAAKKDTESTAEYKARVERETLVNHKATGLGALGFADKQSNRIDIYSSIADLEGKITGSFMPAGLDANKNQYVYTDAAGKERELTNTNFNFIINDVKFSVDQNESLYSVMNKINSSQAGVTLSYSEVTDKFTLTAKQQGEGENIVMGDTNRNLLAALGLQNSSFAVGIKDKTTGDVTALDNGKNGNVSNNNATASYGQNAIAYIDGAKVERSGNEFTVNGIAYSLKETYKETWNPSTDTNGNVTNAKEGEAITLSPDATNLMETVKNFVTDYNALVDLLYGMTTEESFSDYEPLTEEERAAMSESQIKAWEDKAKSGLLRSDSTVSKIFSSLRESFLSSVDGFSLFNLGITYGTTNDSWKSNGKLTISDETKLKSTLESNPDQVRNFFTNSSKGVATKLDKVIDNAVRTTGGQGHRGSLIEIAGLPSTMSETENTIYTQMLNHNKRINSLKDQLEREESRLWTQFTAMEEALAKINEQSSVLSQYLGTGS